MVIMAIMVYDTYNYSIHGVSKPTNKTGRGPYCNNGLSVWLWMATDWFLMG